MTSVIIKMNFCVSHNMYKVERGGVWYCGGCVLSEGRRKRERDMSVFRTCPNDSRHGELINASNHPIAAQMGGLIYVCPFCPGEEWDHYPRTRKQIETEIAM